MLDFAAYRESHSFINKNTIMKRYLYTLLFYTLSSSIAAQYYPTDTLQLNKAFHAIVKGDNTYEKQLDFFEAFPSTWLEYTLTYLYSPEKDFDISMSQLASEHCTIFGDSLYLIDNTTYCNKYVNLVIGLNDTGENCIVLQEKLHATMRKRDNTMMHIISKLRKGHQMQFWAFYWSSTAETSWHEEFIRLYDRHRSRYPKECEIMKIAYGIFENGIDYPNLLPHTENQ